MAISFQTVLAGDRPVDVARRGVLIAVVAFLTLVDLFGGQALLPELVAAYQVDPAVMGFAVNASTFGMAAAGLAVAAFADRLDRKLGIWLSLSLLAIPTLALAFVDDVVLFGLLRVAQGALMATAFILTVTYLSEHCSVTAASGAMAAYITGNVASNLFGRLLATGVAEGIGLSEAFYAFAALNLAGGALAAAVIGLREPRGAPARGGGRARAALGAHLRQPELRSAFIVGFLILFAFVGVYTFVNLELTGPAYGLEPAMLGLVYFVFLPSMLTTPSAGAVARRFGARRVVLASLALAGAGLALTVFGLLWAMLAGLAVVAVGLFFAQGAATGYVGRVATHDHGAASGLYLTSYYLGGLVGAFAVGQAYQAAGWSGVAAAVAAALAAGAAATWRMRDPGAPRREDE